MFKKLSVFLLSGLLLLALVACDDEKENDAPSLSGLDFAVVIKDGTFDPLAGVTANDKEDGDITENVQVEGEVNTKVEGTYPIKYTVTDSGKKSTTKTRDVMVVANPAGGADGATYNFKYVNNDLRFKLMALAEEFLLENMQAGVPLYSSGAYVMYSERVKLPVDEYLPSIEYGVLEGELTEDDSNQIMANGSKGNADEYTFRSALSVDPTTLNMFTYTSSNESAVLSKIQGGLFRQVLTEEKDGFEYVPSMAASLPKPVAGKTEQVGEHTLSKFWTITLKEDLEWGYNKDTDTSGFDNKITTADYLYTYETTMKEKFSRSCGSAGLCVAGVKNAQNFYDGKVEFSEVGVKAIDDYTLEFEFNALRSEWDVTYEFASFTMGPLHEQLFEKYKDDKKDVYGISPKTMAYSGDFILDGWSSGLIKMSANPNAPQNDSYTNKYTGREYRTIKDDVQRFNQLLAGNLDVASMPLSFIGEYGDNPRAKYSSSGSTWRMVYNSAGTFAKQNEIYPGSTFQPEPLLENLNFRKAMYYGVDRDTLVKTTGAAVKPNATLYSDAYMIDPMNGISYRGTDAAKAVEDKYSKDTYGYNRDLAKKYFDDAMDELIDAGTYKKGDKIELEVIYISNSELFTSTTQYIKQSWEDLFKSSEHNIDVTLKLEGVTSSVLYDRIDVGEFDLAFGGVQGYLLDAPKFLVVYHSDDRIGFTYNVGMDTSRPEIKVDTDGDGILEDWSFDAIATALNGDQFVKLGMEAQK